MILLKKALFLTVLAATIANVSSQEQSLRGGRGLKNDKKKKKDDNKKKKDESDDNNQNNANANAYTYNPQVEVWRPQTTSGGVPANFQSSSTAQKETAVVTTTSSSTVTNPTYTNTNYANTATTTTAGNSNTNGNNPVSGSGNGAAIPPSNYQYSYASQPSGQSNKEKNDKNEKKDKKDKKDKAKDIAGKFIFPIPIANKVAAWTPTTGNVDAGNVKYTVSKYQSGESPPIGTTSNNAPVNGNANANSNANRVPPGNNSPCNPNSCPCCRSGWYSECINAEMLEGSVTSAVEKYSYCEP